MRARYVIYRDTERRLRFRLLASNGEVVAPSSESYRDKTDVKRAIKDHRKAALTAKVVDLATELTED